jgi:adenosine deaminase
MKENPRLVEYVADTGVAVEVCLTSNVHTKSISAIKSHPVREYFDKGVVVVPCTDNTVVSGITLSGRMECLLLSYFSLFD